MSSWLEGATAVVTGGKKGHSARIAEVHMEDSADVWIVWRNRKALEAASSRLGVHRIAAAVTKPVDWGKVFDAVLNASNRLDILVNNADWAMRITSIAKR